MIKKSSPLYNNIQKSSSDFYYCIEFENKKNKLICYDSTTKLMKKSYDLPDCLITRFKVIRKNTIFQNDLIIVTGSSFILILDENLEKEIWKLDSLSIKFKHIINNFYVFNAIGITKNLLIFGTLTSELFALKLYDDYDSKTEKNTINLLENPIFRMIHKFDFKRTSITSIISLEEFKELEDLQINNQNEIIISFSNSKILKLLISEKPQKIKIISSFTFKQSFSSSTILKILKFTGELVLISGNINGTISLFSYNELKPLFQFTLFLSLIHI